ncbi:hypothetical protein OAB01_01820 [Bacteroidia bacterium]|jgi:LEA14-like dessication related protein|nr:hypothetical protein [Bacteroidia bacterium]
MKIKTSLLSLSAWMLICSALFTSCTTPSIPDYLRFKVEKIKRVDKKWQVTGNAFFMNNNSFGGNVKTCDIDVFVNDVKAAHINQSIKVNFEAKEEFTVPVTFTIDSKTLRKENEGFLKNVIKGLMGEKVDLRYDGNFVVDIVGVNLKIPFEYEEKVGFGVNYE